MEQILNVLIFISTFKNLQHSFFFAFNIYYKCFGVLLIHMSDNYIDEIVVFHSFCAHLLVYLPQQDHLFVPFHFSVI